MTDLAVPAVVRAKALAAGAADWLDALPDLVASIERDWSISVGRPYLDPTEAFVAEATLADGTPAVLKLMIARPTDDARNEITALRLAGGRGCVRLLRADVTLGALLTERLGRSLHQLGLPVRPRHEILCAAAEQVWRPAAGSGLPTGADKGRWLAEYITATWTELDRPCSERAVDHAPGRLAGHRAAAGQPGLGRGMRDPGTPPGATFCYPARLRALLTHRLPSSLLRRSSVQAVPRPLARGGPARAALALYPPSWRARYGDEVHALLDESGGGARAIASVAWRALPAWIWPPRHLYDRPARMRASLATGLMAWSFLTGLGLVFAQLTQFQGLKANGHPTIQWSYLVFDAALALSVLAAGLGGLPLWLLMLRRAHRERRRRDTVYLLLPLIVPAAYLAGLSVTVRLVGGAQGVSQSWFAVITLVGFAAAGLAAAGPGLALRRLRPRGPALRLAATAGGVATAASVVATVAIIVAVAGLSAWARGFAGYHHPTVPGVYLTLVVAAAAVTAVSAARGTRAALSPPNG